MRAHHADFPSLNRLQDHKESSGDAGYPLVGPQPVVPFLVAQSMAFGKDRGMAEVPVAMMLPMILFVIL